MKKEFETPEIDIVVLNIEDIITTSNEGEGEEGELPIG